METTQGSLVIIGANTNDCKVFWNGQNVPCVGVSVDNDDDSNRVVLKLVEDPVISDLINAGVRIVRVTA